VLDACATIVSDASGPARHGYARRGNAGRGLAAPELEANNPECGSLQWFCIQTHPQAERWAIANLRRQGYDAWLPLIAVQRPDRVTPSIRHTVEIPLWTSYAFVRFDAQHDPWQPIKSTYGVRRLLGDATCPRPVSADVLDHARAVMEATSYPTSGLVVGAACSVLLGPLAGISGVVVNLGRDYAHVSLLMLGQLRSVSVPLNCLKPRDT
jgi:transcriptional antiterminator RfaH